MFLRIGLRFRISTACLYLDGQVLSKADELKYLGVHIKAGKFFRCSYNQCKIEVLSKLQCYLSKVYFCFI